MRRSTNNRHGSRAGFTMVELAIAAVIMLMLFGAVGMATLSGQRAFSAAQAESLLQGRARSALDRIADTVAMTELLGPLPPADWGSSQIQMHSPEAFVGGAVQFGDTTRIALEVSPTDPDDGVDNNGNGLVDERRIVLVLHADQANERRIVLASRVCEYLEGEVQNNADDNGNGLRDEHGLSFALNGEELVVRLSLQQIDPDGRLAIRTYTTSVRPRN